MSTINEKLKLYKENKPVADFIVESYNKNETLEHNIENILDNLVVGDIHTYTQPLTDASLTVRNRGVIVEDIMKVKAHSDGFNVNADDGFTDVNFTTEKGTQYLEIKTKDYYPDNSTALVPLSDFRYITDRQTKAVTVCMVRFEPHTNIVHDILYRLVYTTEWNEKEQILITHFNPTSADILYNMSFLQLPTKKYLNKFYGHRDSLTIEMLSQKYEVYGGQYLPNVKYTAQYEKED